MMRIGAQLFNSIGVSSLINSWLKATPTIQFPLVGVVFNRDSYLNKWTNSTMSYELSSIC